MIVMRALFNILAQVFRSIGANKLRSFLTMFGIAWGVASLLLLVGLGEGFRSGQRRSLAELGTDLIMMWGGTIPVLPEQHVGMHPYKLTVGDAEALRAGAPDVRNVTAFIQRSDLKQVSEFSSAGGQVMGVELNFPDIRHLPIAQGRFLNQDDVEHRAQVVVLGQKMEKLLFPGRPSLGAFITLNGYRFQVIDGMFTNFHMPRTTMLVMLDALVGREALFRAYREALDGGYRFLSFGDSMLIL